MEAFSQEWWEHFKENVSKDQEMKVRGHDEFDENFYVQVNEDQYVIEVSGGEVERVIPNPGFNDTWSFGVEGSGQAWNEFLQENPPAHNNEIIASNYRTVVKGDDDHLKMAGNNKKIFQNLRPFQRMLDLMRVTENMVRS